MKTIFKLITAALAATAFLASCTRELVVENANPESPAEGLRTISVSFDTPTRTYLDILKPHFCAGDSVLLSTGSELDTCEVVTREGRAFIITELEGNLTAVYPYKAAVMGSDNPNAITGINIPKVQTGRFADANICTAQIHSFEDRAHFHNEVSIFRFYADPSIGVDSIKVISPFPITGDVLTEPGVQKSLGDAPIEEELTDSILVAPVENEETVAYHGEDSRIWYVAVKGVEQEPLSPGKFSTKAYIPGLSVSFKSYTQSQGDVTKVSRYPLDGFVVNRIYNVIIPYYVEVRVGGTEEEPVTQKWAYCNVGAFLPEEPGFYFTWGSEEGYNPKSILERPFTDGEYADSGHAAKNENFPDYDPARWWGSKWRTPSPEELEALFGSSSVHVSYNPKGISVENDLLFPYTGIFDENGWGNKTKGYYWSNSCVDDKKAKAEVLTESGQSIQAVERYKGCTIRPIYDEDAGSSTVSISPYVGGGTL